MKFLQIILIIFAAAIKPALADKLNFDGEIRERFEIWDGLNKKVYGTENKLGKANDHLWLQRIILGWTYQSAKVRAKLHLYDARVWGWSLNQNDFIKNKGTADQYVMDPYEENIDLFDGYLETQLNDNVSFQIGRYKIWYGDKRIFGPGSWGNSIGWLWDAARLSYKKDSNFIDILYGQTKTKDPESFSLTAKHAYQGFGIYSHYNFTSKGAIEPFFVWKNALFYNKNKQEDSYFFGFRLYDQDFHKFNYDITAVKEGGSFHRRKSSDLNIDAYAYVIKLGYTFKTLPLKPKLVIGRVYASGDNNPNNDKISTFARPFGSTDGMHYGRLDTMFWGNMIDNQINLFLNPQSKLNLKIAYHSFYLAEKEDKWTYYNYQITNNKYDHIGNEIDLVVKYKYSKSLEFQWIYAHLNAGAFISENNIANNDANRLMLQLQYKF